MAAQGRDLIDLFIAWPVCSTAWRPSQLSPTPSHWSRVSCVFPHPAGTHGVSEGVREDGEGEMAGEGR